MTGIRKFLHTQNVLRGPGGAAVPDSFNSVDDDRTSKEFLAQMSDVTVDGPLGDERVSPDVIHDLIASVDLLQTLSKEGEELHFEGRDHDLVFSTILFPAKDFVPLEVDAKVTHNTLVLGLQVLEVFPNL